MLRDSVVVVVDVRARPRTTPLAMITMRKQLMGFLFFPVMKDDDGAPLGGPSGRRSSATMRRQEPSWRRLIFPAVNFT